MSLLFLWTSETQDISTRMFVLSLFMVFVHCLPMGNAVYCPSQCDCTVKDAVRCSGKTITDIASLGLPTNLTYVVISGTSAAQLNDNCFHKMPVVLRLLLESNQISTITPGAFNDLVVLKTLKLTHNSLASLPNGLFDKLVHLEQLFLDRNSLMHLDQNLFNQLVNLNELFLNRNQLTMLPETLFRNLVKLKVLNLSRNSLASLPITIFNMLASLEKLLLYDNKLTSIDSEIFKNLEKLVELNVFANKIEFIAPDVFNNLHKLQILKLSKNRLQSLPAGLLLHVPSLTLLTLHENPLKELPEVLFGVMDHLTNLWIYKTELYSVPSFVFRNLTNLELLVLTLNPSLSCLPSNAFSGLGALVELSLHTNNLTTLDVDIFQDLRNLRIISLYNNNFRTLPGNLLRPFANLETIYLNDTRLENLPGEFFSLLPKLQEVLLQNNPWRCSCDINDFKDWLQSNLKIVKNPMSLTCGHPFLLQNVPLLSTDRLVCQLPTSRHVVEHTFTSSTPLGTTVYHPADQFDLVVTTNYDNVQTTQMTTGTTSVVQQTTINGSVQHRKHTEASSTSTASPTRSSYSFLDTRKSTSHTELHQTAPMDQMLENATETTSNVATTSNANILTYPGSASVQSRQELFHFKTPYSKIFFYFHLFCITGQIMTIAIAVYVLYKVSHLLNSDSLVHPVVLLKMSATLYRRNFNA